MAMVEVLEGFLAPKGRAALARRHRSVGDRGFLRRALEGCDGRAARLAAGTHDGVGRAADERARSGPLPPGSRDLVRAHRLVTLSVALSVFLLVTTLPGRQTSATSVLVDAALIWMSNVVTFAVWY